MNEVNLYHGLSYKDFQELTAKKMLAIQEALSDQWKLEKSDMQLVMEKVYGYLHGDLKIFDSFKEQSELLMKQKLEIVKCDKKMDAVTNAPCSHKVLIENRKIRVLEVVVEPDKQEPYHHHCYSSILLVLAPTRIAYYNKSKEKEYELKESQVQMGAWLLPPEDIHAVKNLDKHKKFYALRFERKL